MQNLESRLAQFRREHSSVFDRWVRTQKRELIDLLPGSPRAASITRDLDEFVNRSAVGAFVADHVVQRLPPPVPGRPQRVLEICAGTGWLSRRLSWHPALRERRERGEVWLAATDLHTVGGDAGPSTAWCSADALRLPFADQSFDLLICAHAIHHFAADAAARLLGEAVRVARRVSIFDLRRTVYGVAMVGLIAPGYSLDFLHDAVVSHRRAYSLQEMRFLIDQVGLPLRVDKFLSFGMMIDSLDPAAPIDTSLPPSRADRRVRPRCA
ncbi:MAG: class I SAM-dependent methyltransferase [Burkholderiaceae bacterium]